MDVVLYGRLAELAARRVTVEMPDSGCSIADLRQMLAAAYPSLAPEIMGPRVRACAGDVIVTDEHRIDGTEPVEFFPPVSGG